MYKRQVPTLAAGTDARGWADTNTNEALSSYFGRLNYDYKKKYLFMFTFRADGSSKDVYKRQDQPRNLAKSVTVE